MNSMNGPGNVLWYIPRRTLVTYSTQVHRPTTNIHPATDKQHIK